MPEKLDGIDAILEKYAGKEDKLFVALVKKYGPEPEDPYITAKYGFMERPIPSYAIKLWTA